MSETIERYFACKQPVNAIKFIFFFILPKIAEFLYRKYALNSKKNYETISSHEIIITLNDLTRNDRP